MVQHSVQETVRAIDSGRTAQVLKIGMIAAMIAGLATIYFMIQFRGLAVEQAMDQAQIARSLVGGEGFSTRYIRPLAVSKLTDSGRPVPSERFPEFYNAPLSPLAEAGVLALVKNRLQMTTSDILSVGDRAIALYGIVLMLVGVGVWYAVGCLLFDRPLALIAAGLLLVTDLMWQYALSGLPQHLLILLFGLVTLCALNARQADEREEQLLPFVWIAGAALCLGLMSLTHGVAAFMLPGFLAFCLVGFNDRVGVLLVTLIVYLLTILPWLVHNYLACGNPLGLSIYGVLAGAGISESDVMRGVNTGLSIGGGFSAKFRNGLSDQAAHLWEYLGLNIASAAFLISLLHPFRNATALLWRWFLLVMWLGMTIGMAMFGVKGVVSGNQLHVIFLPSFILYGMAFLLVLWNRLNISARPLRIAFLSIVFLVTGVPMLLTILGAQKARIQWPPYVPPFIAVFNNWFQPQEFLCSDMPWAVAWYGNRKCLLLPETVKAFNQISDYGTLGGPITGLYLTPISGSEEFLSLIKGAHKEWGPVIMRTMNLNDFLLKSFTALPIDGECILYADSDRWAHKGSQ